MSPAKEIAEKFCAEPFEEYNGEDDQLTQTDDIREWWYKGQLIVSQYMNEMHLLIPSDIKNRAAIRDRLNWLGCIRCAYTSLIETKHGQTFIGGVHMKEGRDYRAMYTKEGRSYSMHRLHAV